MVITIGMLSSVVGSMNSDFALKFAEAAINKGYKVNLWLSGNATTLSRKNQKSFKDYSYLAKKLQKLIEKGLMVAVCEACASARGIQREDVLDDITSTSMEWYIARAAKSDSVLHIGSE